MRGVVWIIVWYFWCFIVIVGVGEFVMVFNGRGRGGWNGEDEFYENFVEFGEDFYGWWESYEGFVVVIMIMMMIRWFVYMNGEWVWVCIKSFLRWFLYCWCIL